MVQTFFSVVKNKTFCLSMTNKHAARPLQETPATANSALAWHTHEILAEFSDFSPYSFEMPCQARHWEGFRQCNKKIKNLLFVHDKSMNYPALFNALKTPAAHLLAQRFERLNGQHTRDLVLVERRALPAHPESGALGQLASQAPQA